MSVANKLSVIDKHSNTPTPAPSRNTSTSMTSGAPGSKTQTVFIHKLYDMLHDPSISHLIWWSPSSDSFCLLPGEDFSKVLAQYFKHTNIASFIRQLNMYGFHKVNETFQDSPNPSGGAAPDSKNALSGGTSTTSANKWEFRHSTNQFRKGDTDSLKNIKRRSSKNTNSHKEVVNLKSLPPTSNPAIPDHDYYENAHSNPQMAVPQPMYQLGPSFRLYSDDESSIRSRHGSSDSLHQQFHENIHFQQNLIQNSTNSPAPPDSPVSIKTPQLDHPQHLQGKLPHPHSYPPPPPLVTNPSFENSINFKFIELNNQVNFLRSELQVMHNKYDTVANDLKRNQADCLHILEMFEKFVNPVKSGKPDVPNINTNIFNSNPPPHPDRKHNKTPVNKTILENDDSNTSPMSRSNSSHQSNQAAPHVPIQSQISKLKASLLQTINVPQIPSQLQQQNVPHPPSNYHLNDSPHNVTNSRNPSNSNINIVPQHYPLNHHYALYNSHKLNQANPAGADEHGRHLSVMDPLQPVPSRQGSRSSVEDSNVATSSFHMRAKSKSYSPLTIGGVNQTQQNPNQPPQTSNLQNFSSPNRPSSTRSSFTDTKGPPEVKQSPQYPFPIMGPPSTEQSQPLPAIQHNRLNCQGVRTNSLPNPMLDHSQATDAVNPPPAPYNIPTSSYYFNQRNSFSSLYDQNQQAQSYNQQSTPTSAPSFRHPSAPYPPYGTQPPPPPSAPSTLANTNTGFIPPINPLRTDSPNVASNGPPNKSDQISEEGQKKQLPSVSELDISIKGSSENKMFSLLNKDTEGESKDDGFTFKKRRL